MTPLPLVSVIVPAFNHTVFVRDCLDSIATDGYPTIEVVIIDDGSTDGTQQEIEAWIAQRPAATRDLHVRFAEQPNAGIGTTLNRLVERARGEYVVPLASDDQLLPGGIEARIAHIGSHGCKAVFGDCHVIDDKGERLYESGLTGLYRSSRRRLVGDLAGELITNWSVPGPVLLAERLAIRELGGYDEGMLQEDWDLYLRLLSKGWLCFLDRPVAEYRLHPRNLSRMSSIRPRQLADNISTLRKAMGGFRGRNRLLLALQLIAAKTEARALARDRRAGSLAARGIRFASRLVARLTHPC